MNPLCTGFGQYDTHSSGKQNTAALAGQPYTSVTEADILAMVQDPQSIHKDDAQWFIPSDYLAIKGGGVVISCQLPARLRKAPKKPVA